MKIKWTKWRDPLMTAIKREQEEDIYSDRPRRDSDFGPALVTPMGIVPLYEENCPSRIFNFWVGDCDFTFTKGMRREVANLPGVESIDVYTKYRFRIAFGQSFNEDEVKASIEKHLCSPPAPPIPVPVSTLPFRYPYWALVKVGNATDVVGGDSPEEVKVKIPPNSTILKASYADGQ